MLKAMGTIGLTQIYQAIVADIHERGVERDLRRDPQLVRKRKRA